MPKKINEELHQKTKEQILDKSFHIFASRGYSKISMRILAKELGCTTGTLYHYFKNKEELFSHTVTYTANKSIERGIIELESIENNYEKIDLLINFIHQNQNYFKSLLFLTLECFKEDNNFQFEKQALEECMDSYIKNIKDQFCLKSIEDARMIFSLLTGLITQLTIYKGNYKFSSNSLKRLVSN